MNDYIYPLKKYHFKVFIDNVEEAEFSEVSAPEFLAEPIEYRDGNMAGKTVRREPRILNCYHVTLKRGTISSQLFINWMKEVQSGRATRKNIAIVCLDDEMKEWESWQLIKAYPTKYIAPDLNSSANEIAIESLDLVCESMTSIQ